MLETAIIGNKHERRGPRPHRYRRLVRAKFVEWFVLENRSVPHPDSLGEYGMGHPHV